MELNDGVACSNALAGQTVNPTLMLKQPIVINTKFGDTPGPIKDGWSSPTAAIKVQNVYLRFKQRAVELKTLADPNGVDATTTWATAPFPGVFNRYDAEIIIIPQDLPWNIDYDNRPDPISRPAPQVFLSDRRIPITVNVLQSSATSAVIFQCYGRGSAAEASESVVGGAFDPRPASPIKLRCNPDKICFNDAVGLTNNPTCTPPYVSNYIGNFEGTKKYFCTWCNPNK
jgi:hypothetical protein